MPQDTAVNESNTLPAGRIFHYRIVVLRPASSLQSAELPAAYWAPSPNSTTLTVSARINVSSTSELFLT